MDWNAAIEKHREALMRIVAALVAMVGLADAAQSLVLRGCGDTGGTLPRHLRRCVLRLLRPAESAARRLVIALARGLPAPPRRPRKAIPPQARKTKIVPAFLRNGVGTGIVLAPGVSPPGAPTAAARAARPLAFPLLDPLRRWSGRRRPAATSVPRICVPGYSARFPVEVRRPPSPDDPVDATRLTRRLTALARVLDDLPGQARRFARWKARRDHTLAAGRIHRVAPLRGGRPPGGRLSRYEPDAQRRRNIRDVDEILAHAHALAHYALRPDTS
ncbi:MAG TPA: hypothetical protein VGX71_25615 [Pseudaminobacter sp.]|nr:hypothetical protein [Pseudaminobacter sp.]